MDFPVVAGVVQSPYPGLHPLPSASDPRHPFARPHSSAPCGGTSPPPPLHGDENRGGARATPQDSHGHAVLTEREGAWWGGAVLPLEHAVGEGAGSCWRCGVRVYGAACVSMRAAVCGCKGSGGLHHSLHTAAVQGVGECPENCHLDGVGASSPPHRFAGNCPPAAPPPSLRRCISTSAACFVTTSVYYAAPHNRPCAHTRLVVLRCRYQLEIGDNVRRLLPQPSATLNTTTPAS